MSVTNEEEVAGNPASEADYFDVIVIGAGIGGIGAAYRINRRNPKLTYTILERRARLGGTWDVFRYPGVRSDSSVFTLSFPFEPWTRPEYVAEGPHDLNRVSGQSDVQGDGRHATFSCLPTRAATVAAIWFGIRPAVSKRSF